MFLTLFLCLFSRFVSLFSILYIRCLYIVVCVYFSFCKSCLFTIFVQVYRSLPPGGIPFAVNKCHISPSNSAISDARNIPNYAQR